MLKLTVVIVNYHAGEYLRRCLASVERFCAAIEKEVVVVDNGSRKSEKEEALKEFPDVIWISPGKNLGFSGAVNLGIGRTKAPFVLWLNPDAELLDSGLEKVLDDFEANPEWGIAGLRIVDPDGSLQLSARSFPSFKTAFFNRYSLLTRLFPNNKFSREYLKSDWAHDSVKEVDWVSGAACLHRRRVWNKVNGLDDGFFMYCEDVDFCLRGKYQGWKTVFHPGASVMHHIGVSSSKLQNRTIIERHRSIWRYYLKHLSKNYVKDFLIACGVTARCVFCLFSNLFRKQEKAAA